MKKSVGRGNFVSEWFGYRTYPRVLGGAEALRVQTDGRCPFLTEATRQDHDCVKADSSQGVCTIDITFVELSPAGSGNVGIGRFGVIEVQTMDFHGSYRRAVKNLQDALRLHEEDFADVLQKNQRWLSDRIEGPNIANVFKRTFYQMMLKFQLGMHPRSVGAAFAVPQAVWDSWQPHLGRPDLVPQEDGTHVLVHDAGDGGARTWIYVFDLDANAGTNPSPVVVKYTIATDAAAIAQYALQEVPRHAFSEAGAGATLVEAIHRRLSAWWPELALPPARRVESGEGAPPGRRQARGEG